MRLLSLLVLSCLSIRSLSQTSNQKPCSAPEASQFDFWVGDWELTWSDTLHGTNHVEKLLEIVPCMKTLKILKQIFWDKAGVFTMPTTNNGSKPGWTTRVVTLI